MKGKTKTEIITARLTPSEKSAIQKRARKAGMTVTAYLVQCGLGKKIVQVDGLQEVLSELKAQGRNINQLAVLANMGRISSLQIEDLLNAYTKVYSALEKIAREVREYGDVCSNPKQEADSRCSGRSAEICGSRTQNQTGRFEICIRL